MTPREGLEAPSIWTNAMSPHNSDGRVSAFQAESVGSRPTAGSKPIGVCEDCGEVECPTDNLGLTIFYLATDLEKGTYFLCECGKRAYLK